MGAAVSRGMETATAFLWGQRLFEDTPTHRLRLLNHEVFKTGVLNLTYGPES